MAVPKNHTSKMKKRSRKANWKRKANFNAKRSFSLAKSLLKGKDNSFLYSLTVNKNQIEK